MPHAIIDYAHELGAPQPLVAAVHRAMLASGLFEAQAVKTRAHPAPAYAVGENGGSFAHVRVYLLAGRSPEQKQALSQSVLAALAGAAPTAHQVTVDIRDMDRDCYGKQSLG